MNDAEWSRFCGGLLNYINNYYNRFIKTDYTIECDMSISEIENEIWSSKSIDDFSLQLKNIAKQYMDRSTAK